MTTKISAFANKVLNIRPGEWSRLLILYTMYFAVLTGINWGEPVVEAVFLSQIGLRFLPYAFVVNAIFSILSIAIYTAFADRINNTTLLIIILGLSIGGIIIALTLIGGNLAVVAYPLLYFILNVPLLDIFNVHWATYVNNFYDTQSAKRVVPVLGSAARISGIIAGLTLPLLNRYLPHTGIISIWMAMLVIMGLLAWLMPRFLRSRPPAHPPLLTTVNQKTGYRQNISEGFRYVSQSPFLRWMTLTTLIAFTLFPLLNYRAFQLMGVHLRTTENIANFIAMLNGIGNLLALPVQLFLLNRLINRTGLGNASLIFPAGTLAMSSALVFWKSLPTAALAYFNRTTFRTTLRNPIDSLLYNAVPLRVKGRARAFISGLIVPIGSLIGGLLLLIPVVPVSWLLPALIIGLAALFPVSAFITRKQYTQALITMLEQEDFSFILSQDASAMMAADPAALNLLKKKLQQSTNDELSIFMAQLISQIGGKEAISILGDAAQQTNSPRLRAAFIDTLSAAGAGDAARQLYINFLTDPDSRVRQSALTGLEQLAGTGDEQFTAAALTRIDDPDPVVQNQALSALARSGALLNQLTAVRRLHQILAAPNPRRRADGVHILGQTGTFLPSPNLLNFLADHADEVRLEAILAIEHIINRRQTVALPATALQKITMLLHDSVEPVRQTALNILARIGSRDSYEAITNALADPSPAVRNAAVEAMVRVGKPIIPIIHPKLESATPQQRKMAAVILSRINAREFGNLIKTYLTNNLLTIYKNYGLTAALLPYQTQRGIAVLQNILQEQNDTLLDEIFYLLTAVTPADNVRLIKDSLHSENSRVRANASEALEALTSPQTSKLITPLLAPDTPPAVLLKISVDSWEMKHPTAAQAARQLCADRDAPWLRAIMTFALGEIGAEQAAAPPPPRPSPPPNPLAALTGTAKTPPPAKHRPPANLFGASADKPAKPPLLPTILPQTEIETILQKSAADPVEDVRLAAQAAQRILDGTSLLTAIRPSTQRSGKKEESMLSVVEKIIFLKEIPFFQGMTVNQLQALANICEENLFEANQPIFSQGDAGGALYVIVSGRVAIEQEKRAGSFARLATLEARSYFGEMSLFDNASRSATATALQDTLILRIRREPLITLARQHPDLSLELIQVLSDRLRQANSRIAELTRTHPRQLQKIYDSLE